MSQMTVSARLGAAVLRPPARTVDGLRTDRRTRVQDAAPAAGHTGFMVMCLLLVMATFTAVLLLNTSRAEGSYVMSRLTVEQTALHDTKVTLQAELADLESSESLAAAARKLKMVPSTSTATLRLSDGSLTGVASKVDGGRTLTVDLPSTGVASADE
ncbi:hypothetical protein [Ornithinimicrobium cerasi]|uniref:hypothetical protein n=1 Tax=Ornithinimicrobium cerasi TaxID=2248773 RepID=UPI000F00BA94|nr:hypothetical protein [Ornithinimicrobium cerasi]